MLCLFKSLSTILLSTKSFFDGVSLKNHEVAIAKGYDEWVDNHGNRNNDWYFAMSPKDKLKGVSDNGKELKELKRKLV